MQIKNIFKKTLSLVLTLSFFLSFLGFVSINTLATEDRGLIVSPVINEVEAEKGQTYSFTFDLTNDTDTEKYDLNTLVKNFSGDENGTPIIQEFSANEDYSNWISFDEPDFKLDAGEKTQVTARLTVPQEAEAGGYFFALIFANQKEFEGLDEEDTKLLLKEQIATLLFVNVKGKTNRNIEIQNYKTEYTIYDPLFDNLKIFYRIKVDGNSYYRPSGNFLIKNGDEVEKTLPVNPDRKLILPNSGRDFEYEPGEDFSAPLFGNRKIQIKLLYVDSNGELKEKLSEIEVFFFPWKATIALTLLVLVLILLILVYKNFIKKDQA
jgi:hypothetical protein